MLLSEITFDTGWAMAASVVVGAIGGWAVKYRKTADAGRVTIIEAEQKSQAMQLEAVREKANVAEMQAREARERAKLCEEEHRSSEIERAELRGQLKASITDRALLHDRILEAVKSGAETIGRVSALQIQVARDTSETLQLASDHGETRARITKLENGGGKPKDG